MRHLPLLFVIPFLIISCSSDRNRTRPKNWRPVKLEFLETYTKPEISDAWTKAADWVLHNDSVLQKHHLQAIDLNTVLKPDPVRIGSANQNHIWMITTILDLPEVRSLFPKDLKFEWSMKAETEGEARYRYMLYAVKIPKNNPYRITGKHIESAEAGIDQNTGSNKISLTMNEKGARLWEKMTKDNIGKYIAITLDDQVLSCPMVQMPVTGGETQISGHFTKEEAEELANGMNAGR